MGEPLGHAGDVQAEHVLQLQGGDHGRDAGGEAGGDGMGDELDQPPEACGAHRDQQEAGHEPGGEEPREAEARDDRGEDDHEGRRRPRHLELGSPRHRRHGTGDDRGVEPVLGRHADRDGERHGKRQGDDADYGAGEQVGPEGPEVVAARGRPPDRDRERQAARQPQALTRLPATGHFEHVHVRRRDFTPRD